MIFGLFLSLQSFAQDGLDIDVDLGGNDTPGIFSTPIFWVGVAAVIIIVALILNRGKK
jgi:hypothetical protein